ncbi:MAG: GDP-mannose 4,6-dehydratase [Thermoflexales bacterium]|nr:GDP-mannose 4,6-dehydratase [Thermoflexales bacterium]
MRALITGAAGFAGSHLADYLLEQSTWQVSGCILPGWDRSLLDRRVDCLEVDLRDLEATQAMLERHTPDVIFHLAAQAYVPVSWDDPWDTLENNIRAQTNILNALVKLGAKARVLVIGSNEEYGRAPASAMPLREDTPLRPESPYAVSKIAQDYLGLQYFLSHQIPCVRVRPFNHIGPRQSDRFVASAFARQIAQIEAGQQEAVIRVGNLNAQRDFSDVRDMVRAYHLVVTQGEAGEVYNIGSGQPRSVQSLLDILLSLSQVPIRVEIDPARLRPSDTPLSYCDASKVCATTGWTPRIPFEQTLRDTLDYWRTRVKT